MPRDRDVVELLLAQHRRLRPSLIALDKQAAEVLFGAETDLGVQNLRERIESVRRQLEEHFAVEEAFFESSSRRTSGERSGSPRCSPRTTAAARCSPPSAPIRR